MLLGEWRERNGLSVSQLTQKLGVGRDTYYTWINGTSIPTLENAQRIVKLTKGEVSVMEALGGYVEVKSNDDKASS